MMPEPTDPLDERQRRMMGGVSTALIVVGWAGIVLGVIGVISGVLAYTAGGVDAIVPLAATVIVMAGMLLLATAYILRALLSMLWAEGEKPEMASSQDERSVEKGDRTPAPGEGDASG